MKWPKIGMIALNGRQVSGTVVREGAKRVWLRLDDTPNTPTIQRRKQQVRLLFGDTWKGEQCK